jgi:hypothetical protein
VRPAGRTYWEVKVLYTNITESPRARMAVGPKSVGHLLQDRGVEAIVQITARDPNRIAIQADLLRHLDVWLPFSAEHFAAAQRGVKIAAVAN